VSGAKGTLEQAHNRFNEELEEAPRAFSLSDYYLRSFPYVEEEERTEGVHSGKKRKVRKKGAITPLPGAQTLETDIKIRAIVGMRYQNLPDREIENRLGLSRKYANELECKYPEAFDAAEADCVSLVMRDYYRNVNMIRGAAGYAGKIAIETMIDLMEDKDSTDIVRVRAAKAVLDMLDVAGGPRRNGSAAVVEAATGAVLTAFDMAKETERESTIVPYDKDDVVDAEEVDEG
jgi:hypothetical protein